MKQIDIFRVFGSLFIGSIVLSGCSHFSSESALREPASKSFRVAGATKPKPERTFDFHQSPLPITDSFYSPPTLEESAQNKHAAGNDMPYAETDDPSFGHWPIVERINAAAPKTDFHMIMFNLSDRDVANAMVNAQARGVNVSLIIDHNHYCNAYPEETTICPLPKPKPGEVVAAKTPTGRDPDKEGATEIALTMLRKGGVTVTASSPSFSLTHVKSFSFVDGRNGKKTLVVTSMNQTLKAAIIRDFGVVTTDPAAVQEFDDVFRQDLINANSAPPAKNDPLLSVTNLIWSPRDSTSKLVGMINSAPENGEIDLTVEEFTETAKEMIAALQTAARDRHVKVRIIVPLCNDPSSGIDGKNHENILELIALNNLGFGIDARGSKGPPTLTNPYTHQKMITVRDAQGNPDLAYIGSINYSNNSMVKARELGIVINADRSAGSEALRKLLSNFVQDWNGPKNSSTELDLSDSAQALRITEEPTEDICPKLQK